MKNYLIVGGSSGIGKALVNLINKEGQKAFVTYNKTVIKDDCESVNYHFLDATSDKLDLPHC